MWHITTMYQDIFSLSLNKNTFQKQSKHNKCLRSVTMEKVLVHINVSHVKPLSKYYTVELDKCPKLLPPLLRWKTEAANLSNMLVQPIRLHSITPQGTTIKVHCHENLIS
jgi:hypothetical protein